LRISADGVPPVACDDACVFRQTGRQHLGGARRELDVLYDIDALRALSRYRIADLRAASCRPCALLARKRLI
jgi:hypothetical protein